MSARRVGALIAASLEAQGVDLVFCVPGESFLGLTDAFAEHPALKLIVCRHEGGASYMAVADGRMRAPRAGVCLVSRGPGVSNAMIGLHTAHHDAVPMVLLIGDIERKDRGRGALQEQDYGKLLADTVKAVVPVDEPAQASEAIARAFHLAESGTPGPVAVILPEELLDEEAAGVPLAKPRPLAVPGPDPAQVDTLATMLAEAERPLVWVGGAMDGPVEARDELVRLAETWGLPVCPTHRRPHLFDSHHPNYGGYIGNRVQKPLIEEMHRADLMLALGERISDAVSQSYSFPAAPDPQLPLVHVWPDPSELNRVFRADLPMACSPRALVQALLARPAPMVSEARRAWVAGLHAIHRRLMEPAWQPAGDGLNFAAVFIELGRQLAPDATVTTDAGNFTSFMHRYVPFRRTQCFLGSAVGGMGAAVPMAVAASLRWRGRQSVAVVGDGGALMTGNEIATAMMYGTAPVILVCDNRSYGSIAMHHENRYPGRPPAQAGLVNPDFAAWARAFGADGYTITEEKEVAPVLAAALAARDRPAVVHVKGSAQQVTAWRRRG
jgi:acetolactate synthase-1/2/3 large subunit